jgi:hypothetical protein
MRRSALVLAGLLLLVSGAVASGKLKEKSTTFTVPAEATAEGAAKCKKGQEAVSGGFLDPIDFFGGHVVLPYDSTRASKRKWSHHALNVTIDDDRATVYAYCDPDQPHLKVKTATTTSDNRESSVTAQCRRGQEAVSGGFATDADDEFVFPLGSKRVGKRGWISYFINGTDDPVEFTSFAYCDKAEPGLKEKANTAVVESPNTDSVTAKCRRGRRVISGGFEAEFSLSESIFPFINGSRRAGRRGWEVTAAVGMSEPAEITAYAYCEKKERK